MAPLKLTKEGVSKVESVTQPGASWNTELGEEEGSVVLVAQWVPSAQVPPGEQLAGPGVKEDTQPAGNAGAVTASKFSFKKTALHGTGVGVVGGVGVGEGEGVGTSEITKIVLLVPVMEALRVSVAVIVWFPNVWRLALKVPNPLVNVLSGGRLPWLVLVKWTVPV